MPSLFVALCGSSDDNGALLSQTNDAYVQYLVQLHNKLEFAATKARHSAAEVKCHNSSMTRARCSLSRAPTPWHCRMSNPNWSVCA
jgi:hypothetical protein